MEWYGIRKCGAEMGRTFAPQLGHECHSLEDGRRRAEDGGRRAVSSKAVGSRQGAEGGGLVAGFSFPRSAWECISFCLDQIPLKSGKAAPVERIAGSLKAILILKKYPVGAALVHDLFGGFQPRKVVARCHSHSALQKDRAHKENCRLFKSFLYIKE